MSKLVRYSVEDLARIILEYTDLAIDDTIVPKAFTTNYNVYALTNIT